MRASLGRPFLTNWPYDLVCFAFQRSHGGLPHARENATTRQWNAACVDRHLGSISYRLGFSKAELTPRQRLPLDANTYAAASLGAFNWETCFCRSNGDRGTQRAADLTLLIKDTRLADRSRHSQSSRAARLSRATVRAKISHVRSLLPSASPNHCRR